MRVLKEGHRFHMPNGSQFESGARIQSFISHAALAQLVEFRISNPVVVGSSPTCRSEFCARGLIG